MGENKKAFISMFLALLFLVGGVTLLQDQNKSLTGYAVDFSKVDPASGEGTWTFNERLDLRQCRGDVVDLVYDVTITEDKGLYSINFPRVDLGRGQFRDQTVITGEFRNGKVLFGQSRFGYFYIKDVPNNPFGKIYYQSGSLTVADDCNSASGDLFLRFTPDSPRDGSECSLTSNFNIVKKDNLGCTLICEEDWQCGEWSECSPEGKQMRTCSDVNSCRTEESKPAEEQECVYVAPEPEPAPETGPNYGLISGVIAVLVAAGAAWYFLKYKKKGKKSKASKKASKKKGKKRSR